MNDEAATAPVILDRSIFTAKTNISNLFVDDQAAKASPFTEGTDYEIVNATTGEIKILSTGSITTAMSLYLTYNYTTRSRFKITPGKNFTVTGKARFEIETMNGKPQTWKVNNAEIVVEGDMPISPDNWSEATIVINVLVDKTVMPTEPMGEFLVG